MPYDIEETGELTRTATVTVAGDEFDKRVKNALKDLADEVEISGFRKGNVPMGMLRQRYGDRVQPEVIEELIRENIQTVAKDFQDRLLHLGETRVTSLPEDGEDLEFQVDLELQPELDPVGYLGLTVEKPEPEVTDEEVDEQLEQLREEYATLEPIELRSEIKEGDIVTFDFEPAGEDERLDDFTGEDIQAEIGSGQVLPAIEEGLEGAEFHSTITVDIEGDENFPIEELRGQEIPLTVSIKAVKQKMLPQLDDEFAKDTGEAQTLLELRSKMREQIKEAKEHRAEHMAMENLVDTLVEQNDFPLPERFVEEQVDNELERREEMFKQHGLDMEAVGGNTEEFREETRKEVEQNIRAELLLLSIAEKEGFEIEEADIDRFFEHQAQHDERFSAEQLKQFMRQNEEQWRNVQYQALQEKTRNFLLEEADIETVPWPEQQPGLEESTAEEVEEAEADEAEESEADDAEESSETEED